METRRLLVAALLSMAVLLLWQKFFPPPAAVRAPVEETAAATPAAQPLRTAEETAPAPPPVSPVEATPEESPAPADEGAAPTVMAAALEEVVLEDDTSRAIWSNHGAQLVGFELKHHATDGGGVVDLVRHRHGNELFFSLVGADGADSPLNDALFAVERQAEGATFTYRGPAGSATKRVRLRPDGLLSLEVEAAGDWRLVLGPGLRNPVESEAKSRFARRAAVYMDGGKVSRVDANRAKEATEVAAAGLEWIGLQDRYFLAAALPVDGWRSVSIEPMLFDIDAEGLATFHRRPEELSEAEKELGNEVRVLIAPTADRLTLDAYLGSKQLDRLGELPGGLEKTVELGFFGILSRPLLKALQWIYDHIVGNYGWAIILLTVLIRLVLFPLNHKSIVSMQKMQKVNPKMQAIRAKYRGKLKDKKGRPNAEASSKMNQEIMELYKQEGVNPAAGCLPMLLQMPVLFAFYSLLSAAVELRQAPWLGWISDLSAPDPYYVLPLIMGASMLIQQRMSPAQGDPMQRRLFMFMPIIFTVMFLGFPAGMVLYWLTNNILAIAQQAAYKRYRTAAEES
jgi:YidC/Oxa1 family membrane protein insertase